MSRAIKGALVSALVFPGLGEILLKSYCRGIVLATMTLACIAAIVGVAVQRAQEVLDFLVTADGAVDLDAVSEAVEAAASGAGSRVAQVALLLLGLCWVVSVVDAYRIGRELDAGEARGR